MKRRLTIEDLKQIEYLSDPQLSETGALSYTVNTVKKDGGFEPHLFGRWNRHESCHLLSEESGHMGRWNQEGTVLYFLSDPENCGADQLCRMEAGKDPEALTHCRHGVSWFFFAGDQILFEAVTFPQEAEADLLKPISREEREMLRKQRAASPIEVEEIMYKFDETHGIPDGHQTEIGSADLKSGTVFLLTHTGKDYKKPVLSPDGSYVLCYTYPNGGWQKKQAALTRVNPDGSEVLLTKEEYLLDDSPAVFLDPDHVIVPAYEKTGDSMRASFLIVNPENGTKKYCWDENASSEGPGMFAAGHTAYGDPGNSFGIYENGIWFLSAEKGDFGLFYLDAGEKKISKLFVPHACVQGADVRGKEILAVIGTTNHIGSLYLCNAETGSMNLLARHNEWMEETETSIPEEVWIPSSKESDLMHGWIIRPYGYQEGKRYPAVLDIHGGPECFYPADWWFEFQYLAARGFAVLYCDPHGSTSYGRSYGEGAWNGTAYQDLLKFADYAIERGIADPEKIGVTGGSYGGWMTNYIISHTNRFAAAVTQRNLCNRTTSYGTGDMGSILENPFRGVYASMMSRLNGDSTTLKWIDQVKTPLLILHGTEDYRCSFEQAEQFFIAMKDRNPEVPVKFDAFLHECHELTRSGNTYAQMGHLKEMADWFCTYLKGENA